MPSDRNKPCPFCGGPAVCVGFEFVTCSDSNPEDCPGRQVQAEIDGPASAPDFEYTSTAWNTRAPTLFNEAEAESLNQTIAHLTRLLKQ